MQKNNISTHQLWGPMPTSLIIHLFAVAHAVVAVTTRALDYYDDVPLTLLTISLVVIISIRHRLQVELAAVLTLAAGFFGFLAGGYGGWALRTVLRSDLWAPAITTFLVTEAIGWGTLLFAQSRRSKEERRSEKRGGGSTSLYIIFSAVIILVVRVGYILILRHLYGEQESIYPALSELFSNSFAVLLLVCCTVIATQLYINNRNRISKRWHHPFWILASVLSVAAVTTLYGLYGLHPSNSAPATFESFLRLFSSVLLVAVIAYALLYLGHHVVRVQHELRQERLQRHRAQWQYSRFKQQINPHFLFNSLNILDILVQEGERERAGSFIRKLAGIYRYMLRNEEEELVTLREEMEFAEMYIDLIQERFTDGLIIRREIPTEALNRQVPPCAIQQLIENATKHNIVSHEQPLHIELRVEGERFVVENNLQPRLSRRQTSTQLGLKGLSQQYHDIANQEISISRSDSSFRVEIPLLKSVKA